MRRGGRGGLSVEFKFLAVLMNSCFLSMVVISIPMRIAICMCHVSHNVYLPTTEIAVQIASDVGLCPHSSYWY